MGVLKEKLNLLPETPGVYVMLDKDGVVNVDVNLKKKTATVEMGLDIEDQTFISAITEAGYEVKKIS